MHRLGIDIGMCSAHKLYGPQGCGALFLRRGLHLPALIHGGGQEGSRRSGTENVAAISGFGLAAQLQQQEADERLAQVSALSQAFVQQLQQTCPEVTIHGAEQVPGIFYAQRRVGATGCGYAACAAWWHRRGVLAQICKINPAAFYWPWELQENAPAMPCASPLNKL